MSQVANEQSRPPIEIRFKENLVGLITYVKDLIERIHNYQKTGISPDILVIVSSIIQGHDSHDTITLFIKHSYPYWSQICNKEEIFFVENCSKVFKSLPMQHVDAFRVLIETKDSQGNNVISNPEKEQLWEYFHMLVKGSIKYIHQQRKPGWETVNGRYSKVYRAIYFTKEIEKLGSIAKQFQIKLEW